eukprot:366332-Chlamydomonas_euryale.AAC.4
MCAKSTPAKKRPRNGAERRALRCYCSTRASIIYRFSLAMRACDHREWRGFEVAIVYARWGQGVGGCGERPVTAHRFICSCASDRQRGLSDA